MHSILRQLDKYQQPTPADNRLIPAPEKTIEIKQAKHPYQDIVEAICDITDPAWRKEVINDALLALNDFVPPPMTDQLYPLETAILYHLFYHRKITLCGESRADAIFAVFLKNQDIDTYMRVLKNCLDKDSTMIFLYRVMLAAFGARGKWDNKRDHVSREYGVRAARALGVEPSAKVAGRGLDSLANVDVEHLILGRITYIAFWEWSRLRPVSECGSYLVLPSGGTPALAPNRPTLAALPPHRP